MEDILPIKPPIDFPVWDQTSYLIVLGVGMGLALLAYLVLKPKPRALSPKIEMDPLLEECLWCEKLIESGEHEAAVEKLEELMRLFLEQKHEASLEALSESEVALKLQSVEGDTETFEAFFLFLEPIKFAGKEPEKESLVIFHQHLKSHLL